MNFKICNKEPTFPSGNEIALISQYYIEKYILCEISSNIYNIYEIRYFILIKPWGDFFLLNITIFVILKMVLRSFFMLLYTKYFINFACWDKMLTFTKGVKYSIMLINHVAR